MTIEGKIKERIQQEQETLDTLSASLPDLQERLRIAEEHADNIEARLLLNEAAGDLEVTGASEQTLRNAKRAERERRREVERTERDVRIATVMLQELHNALTTVQGAKVDKQLQTLARRIPKIAEDLTNAWLQYEAAAMQADAIKTDLRALKRLVPIRSIPVSLPHRIPEFPDLERVRRSSPTNLMTHPANVMRDAGHLDLAEKIRNAS